MVTRKRTPTIMDGLVIRYQFGKGDGEISASRNGVAVGGTFPMINDTESRLDFVDVFNQAWRDFKAMQNGFEPSKPCKAWIREDATDGSDKE